MPKYLRLCAVTTGKLLDARREDAIRFLTAQMQGYSYALANRDEELRITREIAGIKAADPHPEFMFAEAARADTGIDPKMPIPMDKLEWLQEQLVKAGNLSQPFDVNRGGQRRHSCAGARARRTTGLIGAFVWQRRYAWPARTRRPGIAPVCSPRSKVGVPARSVAT